MNEKPANLNFKIGGRPIKFTLYDREGLPLDKTKTQHATGFIVWINVFNIEDYEHTNKFYIDVFYRDKMLTSFTLEFDSSFLFTDGVDYKKYGVKKYNSKTFVFLHIPKTAGTSLIRSLIQDLPDACNVHMFDDIPGFNPQGLQMSNLQKTTQGFRNFIDLYHGHMNYGIHNLLTTDVSYITVLRYPLDAVLSSIRQIVSFGALQNNEDTLRTYIENVPGMRQSHDENVKCKGAWGSSRIANER